MKARIKLTEEQLKTIIAEQANPDCVVNTQAESSVVANPQMGDTGINQNFVNNMHAKPTQFYNTRMNAISQKLSSLRTDYPLSTANGFQGFCQGENPLWQAKLNNKLNYVQQCMNNPGSC
jgi:hypothetical protein